MNEEEMKSEIGDKEINVKEMFKKSTEMFKKYLPDIKDSIRTGNFIIDKDESNNYYFKLLNFNKEVIFISNKYDSIEKTEESIKEVINNA